MSDFPDSSSPSYSSGTPNAPTTDLPNPVLVHAPLAGASSSRGRRPNINVLGSRVPVSEPRHFPGLGAERETVRRAGGSHQQRRRQVREVQTRSFTLHVSNELSVENIDVLYNQVEAILSEAERDLSIGDNDQAAIRVTGRDSHGVEFDRIIPYRAWRDLDADAILDLIEQVLQSNREIDSDVEIEVSVHHPSHVNGHGRNRKVTQETLRLMTVASHNIVSVNTAADVINEQKNCKYQVIYIGLALLVHESKIDPIDELLIADNTYHKLVKSSHRYQCRKRGVEYLKQVFGECEQDFDLFQRVQARYHIQVVVYVFDEQVRVKWPTCVPVQTRLPTLNVFGYLSDEAETAGDLYHYDFVIRAEGLLSTCGKKVNSPRQCDRCFVLYARKVTCNSEPCHSKKDLSCNFCHCCRNVCPTCCTQECGRIVEDECDITTFPFPNRVLCNLCHFRFFSPKCATLHEMSCRMTKKKLCADCGKTYHGETPCNSTWCFMCGKSFLRDNYVVHECFVQPVKPAPPSLDILVYDFECVRDEQGVHIPYLCTAYIASCASKANLETCLKRYFPHVTTPDGKVVFVFWGLPLEQRDLPTRYRLSDKEDNRLYHSVLLFWEFLSHPFLSGFTCVAHNAKAYDAIIVKKYFTWWKQYSDDIARGKKIICMMYEKLRLRFIDSTCFIPSALRKLSSDFGLNELKKGFFPHAIMTLEYFKEAAKTNFIVAVPMEEDFAMNYRNGAEGIKEEKEFLSFYAKLETQSSWDMKTDAIAYCISDTVLLGECFISFRSQFMEIAKQIDESIEFDPFSYMTLPSAMMALFLSTKLEKNTIGIIDRSSILIRRQSYASFLFAKKRWGEFELLEETVAYFPNAGRLAMYSDCYMDGCEKCFMKHQYNQRLHCSMGECRDEFIRKRVRWGKRYPNCFVSTINPHTLSILPEELMTMEDELPLDPREAYKGGKVELYKLVYSNEIQMCDFVSEYPTTLLGTSYDPLDLNGESVLCWPFPVGQPVVQFHPSLDKYDESLIGVIKCRVLPPDNLYAPFLSHRVYYNNTYEVMYGLCRTCMTHRLWPCSHSEEERSFVGTWTLAEIHHAVKLGYQILSIVDMWTYPSQQTDMFRSFIVPFMVEKILSKKDGIVDGQVFTGRGLQIKDYLLSLSGKEYTPDAFDNRPARRTVAKLAQNSFTGKWGEKEVHRTCQVYDSARHQDVWNMFQDSNVEMRYVSILDEQEGIICAEYSIRELTSRTARKKNDVIVAHITAYGRIMLSRLEQQLGHNLLYEDTDSAFHKRLDHPAYKHGFRTGDLELELESAYDWVCLGRKWYSYSLSPSHSVSKLKGFTLSRSSTLLTDSTRMKEYLISLVEKKLQEEPQEQDPILIPQMVFRTIGGNHPGRMEKQTVQFMKQVRFFTDKMKRYVDLSQVHPFMMELDSFPFGYQQDHSVELTFTNDEQPLLVWEPLEPHLFEGASRSPFVLSPGIDFGTRNENDC